MKLFSILCLMSFLLFSCSDGQREDIVEPGEVLSTDLPDTCSCDELTQDSLGFYYSSDGLYSGVCISNYPNTDLRYIEKNILEGKLHGKVTYYDKAGKVLMEEIYESGKSKRSGDNLECQCSELIEMKQADVRLPSRYSLDDIPFSGKCKTYFGDSVTVAMEASYENGYLHGYTTYYGKSGEKLYMEKYYQGVLETLIN